MIGENANNNKDTRVIQIGEQTERDPAECCYIYTATQRYTAQKKGYTKKGISSLR